MEGAFVVTGGGRGVGRAIALRLARDRSFVVVLDASPPTEPWPRDLAGQLDVVVGDAADAAVAESAADRAGEHGRLAGWVNNAAVFEDASLSESPTQAMEVISTNVALAVTGCGVAIRRFLGAGSGGSVVNVSSHQAQRAVRGALPYATAKAAVEGLTRAAAVDYGRFGIRVNAVALGSIRTERYDALLASLGVDERQEIERQMAQLHPLGRIGEVDEVAEAVAWLLSDAAAFVSGAVIPIDGGRSARGADPEER